MSKLTLIALTLLALALISGLTGMFAVNPDSILYTVLVWTCRGSLAATALLVFGALIIDRFRLPCISLTDDISWEFRQIKLHGPYRKWGNALIFIGAVGAFVFAGSEPAAEYSALTILIPVAICVLMASLGLVINYFPPLGRRGNSTAAR